jgi:hypothetical protein
VLVVLALLTTQSLMQWVQQHLLVNFLADITTTLVAELVVITLTVLQLLAVWVVAVLAHQVMLLVHLVHQIQVAVLVVLTQKHTKLLATRAVQELLLFDMRTKEKE